MSGTRNNGYFLSLSLSSLLHEYNQGALKERVSNLKADLNLNIL